MVNVRATLRAAVCNGIVDEGTACIIARVAKRRFYAERTYSTILDDAQAEGVDTGAIDALRNWLPAGRVDQKAIDARMLLCRLRHWLATGPAPKRVAYRFEPTDAWHEATRVALASLPCGDGLDGEPDEALVEELKVAGSYRAVRDGAAARAAAVDLARRAGVQPDAVALRSAVEELRRARNLHRREDFERWCTGLRLDDAGMARFVEDQARIAWARPLSERMARAALADHLRASGDYDRIASRAEAKARRRADIGTPQPSLRDVDLDEEALWLWYFEERLQRERPNDLDAFARAMGFTDADAMRAAVLRDRWHEDEWLRSKGAKGRQCARIPSSAPRSAAQKPPGL
jgi:hypothetical protein